VSRYRQQLARDRRARAVQIAAPPDRPLRKIRAGETIDGHVGETVAVVDSYGQVLGHVHLADGGRLKVSTELKVVNGRIEAR
jgi:hypothetical protein